MKATSRKKSTKAKVVFLFDVDNTLLNNDAVTGDIRNYLDREVGSQRNERYWEIFERLRSSLGYADYLGALQRYRRDYPHDLHLLKLSRFLVNYPFANRLYPGSLDAIQHVKKSGLVALLSDGDVVFQPRKVERSGLLEAVEGRAMIYVHKEKELKDVERRHPSHHYVLIDDKLRILTAVKKTWRTRVTTIFVRQGHYALDPKILAKYPPADLDIQSIGDIVKMELGELVCGRVPPPKTKSK
jgi:FMN phosphatase YigB (HAD superfamily)